MATTNYLSDFELICKSGKSYPEEWKADRLPPLRATFNTVRVRYGTAVRALSAYRDPDYNAWLREQSILRLVAAGRTRVQAEAESGVAKHSQHIEGRALDIVPAHLPRDRRLWTAEHYTEMDVLEVVVEELIATGKLPYLGGFGKYPRWLHIDTRPTGGKQLARWGSR